MRAVREWSVRHAAGLSRLYGGFEPLLKALAPLLRLVGYERLERPVGTIERGVKGFLFDCQMCGECILAHTGLSCPMNCPKGLRNGPCGGVRADGGCEIRPEMRCVWVAAWEGSQRMHEPEAISELQKPVDHRLKGRSAWLRVARGEGGGP